VGPAKQAHRVAQSSRGHESLSAAVRLVSVAASGHQRRYAARVEPDRRFTSFRRNAPFVLRYSVPPFV